MTKPRTKRKSATSARDRATAYAEAVLAGEIVAGPHVRNACRRHLDDLKQGKKRGLSFDEAAADHAFGFFEKFLRLSGGQFEGRPFQLAPSQAFIVGSLFGWKNADGSRRFRRAFIEEGKGNGKSPLAGGIGLYGLMADGEDAAEIYPLASHRDQAMILFRDAVSMVKRSPALKHRLKFSGGEGKEWNIAHLKSGSFMRALSRNAGATGSGVRPHFGLADEIHEMKDRTALEMLERGFKFRRSPLLLMITNSGSDRNSVCWEEHEHAVRVAAGNVDAVTSPVYIGEVIDDTTFSYVCALDEGDDALADPSCWIKANPLLGVTITEEYLAGVVKQARDIPGRLNAILRLHFCMWTDAPQAWLPSSVVQPCLADFDPADHRAKRIFVGLDLSEHRDLTVQATVVRTGEKAVPVQKAGKTELVMRPTFDAWIEAWTPADTLDARELRDKMPYATWVQRGFLHAPPGSSVSFLHVAQKLAEYDRDYEIGLLAYDRYAFKRFEEEARQIGLNPEYVEHPQGGVKKGKATEAMKAAAKAAGREAEGLWMPGSVRLVEEALLEGRLRLRRNPVLVSAIMSAVTEEDQWGNRWLSKRRAVNKIDAAVALAMAMGAAMAGDTGVAVEAWLKAIAA